MGLSHSLVVLVNHGIAGIRCKTLSHILRLVAGLVPQVEESSKGSTGPGADHKGPEIGVEEGVRHVGVVLFKDGINSVDRVGCDTSSNSRVEAGTKFVGSGGAAKKASDDADGGIDTTSSAGGVLTLDHQDDANEEEGANNLVNKYRDVHLEIVVTVVGFTSNRVGGSKDW